MMNKTEYLTQEGMEALERELHYLTTVSRARIAERLNQILEEGGDPNENTEYETAKNEQALLEEKIARMTQILRNARVIETSGDTDTVQLGSRVTVKEKGASEEEIYHIVGSAEANPLEGKVSFESPMGKALMGKKVGEKAVVHAPDGDITFRIKSIE